MQTNYDQDNHDQDTNQEKRKCSEGGKQTRTEQQDDIKSFLVTGLVETVTEAELISHLETCSEGDLVQSVDFYENGVLVTMETTTGESFLPTTHTNQRNDHCTL